MTRVFERQVDGPSSRALVIGVGAYPIAKPGNGAIFEDLKDVADIPSAATGAALFTDWLISNADTLSATLASVDILLNVQTNQGELSGFEWVSRYPGLQAFDPRNGANDVDKPTRDNVYNAGQRWWGDISQGADNVAILYICGHGAIWGAENLVFLSDLNERPANGWDNLLNIQTHVSALKTLDSIKAGFVFVDACAEYVPAFDRNIPGNGAQFATSAGKMGSEKVILITAASSERKAYEGNLPNQEGKTGRFTQCVLQGLKGAATANYNSEWIVNGRSLSDSLTPLYELNQHKCNWIPKPFSPALATSPNRFPIVRFDKPPLVPVLVRFKPKPDGDWSLSITDSKNSRVRSRDASPPEEWWTDAEADESPYRLDAMTNDPTLARSAKLKTYQPEFIYEI